MSGGAGDVAAPAIRARSLSFRYRGAGRRALDDVTLDLPTGSWGLLLGSTGAGKSTLVRCLNRSIPSFFPGDLSGSVTIAGQDTGAIGVPEMSRLAGIVFQDFETQIFCTTCLQEAAFAMENRGLPPAQIRQRAAQLLTRVGLAGLASRDPSTLSGGEKQRLVIASVLALEAPLLVLDEPASDLDPGGRESIYGLIGSIGSGAILLVEHDLEGVPATGPATLLGAGRVERSWEVTGPEALIAMAETIHRAGVKPPPMAMLTAMLNAAHGGGNGSGGRIEPRDLSPESLDAELSRIGWSHDTGIARAAAPAPGSGAHVRCDGVGRVHEGGGRRVEALSQISCEVRRGEMVALIGPNGSGKTTLLQVMAGLQRPDTGRVSVDGRDPGVIPSRERARLIGYLFQNPDNQIFSGMVREEVAFGPLNLGLPPDEVERRVGDALSAVGLDHAEAVDPFTMTKGERQRLALASVLAMEPSIIVMDEPTTGLDLTEQSRVMRVLGGLKERGHTVIFVTHALSLIHQPVDRVILLDAGRTIAEGTPAAILTDVGLMRRAGLRPPDYARLAHLRGVDWLTLDAWLRGLRPPMGST